MDSTDIRIYFFSEKVIIYMFFADQAIADAIIVFYEAEYPSI
jgi:hypothetical protein